MTRVAALVLAALAACGGDIPHSSSPGPARGCASGTGYALPGGAIACPTPRSATTADLETTCASGWAPCAAPPAGCQTLPAYYIGALAWRPLGGTDQAGGCGVGPAGSISIGLGCGSGAQREVAPRCGGYRLAADLPWGRGVLCCQVAP